MNPAKVAVFVLAVFMAALITAEMHSTILPGPIALVFGLVFLIGVFVPSFLSG